MANAFKDKLKRDEVVVVLNPDHPSPSLTEFVAGLGFEGVSIDCEHGVATVERVQDMCRAARAAGIQSIVRPESNAPFLITRYLDAGAGGVMAPHVETAAARQIVETVRYARPKDHEDKVVVAMIESLTAVANLPEILSVEGIDVFFFIGPNDLSHSMGYPAQMHHPEVKGMVKKASASIRAAGKTPGTLVVGQTVAEFVAAGCRFLYEHANSFIVAGASDFKRRVAESATGAPA